MSSKSMSLKARINQYSKSRKVAAQVVLQNYMFERFLERLSLSEYQYKFVVKGGMLISGIVGLDTRSTMDLDTTVREMLLTEETIRAAINEICLIDLHDDVRFNILSISTIRKDDPYGGYCIRLDAIFDTIITPLSIDISTGDVITPEAISYEFSCIFDESISIKLWGYNIETVMAEKLETILSRGTLSTRPRDYYDIFIITKTQNYDEDILDKALIATADHRGTTTQISDTTMILKRIEESGALKEQWTKYQKKFEYAKDISYEEIIEVLKHILKIK